VVGLLDATVVLGHGGLLGRDRTKGADSSGRRYRAERALLLALLLAVPVGAQDGGTPEDDVLDWLSGGTQEQEQPPPAPPPEPEPQPEPDPAPPQEAGDDVLDWLSGPQDEAGPPAPFTTEPAPGEPVARPAQGVPRSAGPSPAAVAYATQLRDAMTLELKAQEYENNTLGTEKHPETLQSFKKQRYERLQQDKAGFRETAGQMSLQPLETPRPAPGVTLSREAVAILSALDGAIEATRATRPLDQYVDLNQAFLTGADWLQRDRAVTMRDEIVTREVALARLAHDAITLASGGGDDELIASMRKRLQEVAPEAETTSDDVAVMVVRNKELRAVVLDEARTALGEPAPTAAPPRPDAELRPRVVELAQKLLDDAGVPPLLKEHADLTAQIADLDEQLEGDLPQDKRLALVGRRTPLIIRRNELEVQWLSAQPDPTTWDELIPTTQELIRRRLIDLGPAGVLYGARADSLDAVLADGLPDKPSQWNFFEEQQKFLGTLDGLQPSESNPLNSLVLPDMWGMALMQEAQEKVALEKLMAAQAAAESAPKPTMGKGKGGKPAAKKPPKKPPMQPKPKPMGKKGYGKKKKPY
jgi:hypothetical protein